MARCNCSPRCHVCGDGPCDCTCTEAAKKAHPTQPAQAVDVGALAERVCAELYRPHWPTKSKHNDNVLRKQMQAALTRAISGQ